LEMVYLLKNCRMVLTDSGGLQKEAYFFNKPCVTLREQTEWIELVQNNFNILTGSNFQKILDSVAYFEGASLNFDKQLYGDGKAASKIVEELLK